MRVASGAHNGWKYDCFSRLTWVGVEDPSDFVNICRIPVHIAA